LNLAESRQQEEEDNLRPTEAKHKGNAIKEGEDNPFEEEDDLQLPGGNPILDDILCLIGGKAVGIRIFTHMSVQGADNCQSHTKSHNVRTV
jgi:hypothetical protein